MDLNHKNCLLIDIDTVTMKSIIFILLWTDPRIYYIHRIITTATTKNTSLFGEMHKNGISSDGNTLCVEDGPQ